MIILRLAGQIWPWCQHSFNMSSKTFLRQCITGRLSANSGLWLSSRIVSHIPRVEAHPHAAAAASVVKLRPAAVGVVFPNIFISCYLTLTFRWSTAASLVWCCSEVWPMKVLVWCKKKKKNLTIICVSLSASPLFHSRSTWSRNVCSCCWKSDGVWLWFWFHLCRFYSQRHFLSSHMR